MVISHPDHVRVSELEGSSGKPWTFQDTSSPGDELPHLKELWNLAFHSMEFPGSLNRW